MSRKLPLPSRAFVVLSLWAAAWLVVIDVAVNLSFGSAPVAGKEPSALNRYFEYGRSVEGKLTRMVADPKGAGLILSAGWLDPEILKTLPDRPQDGADLLVGVYGQSFAFNAAKAAAATDGRITLRGVGGPAAPPNHSYAAYIADATLRRADVAIFGVLSSSIGHMRSMSGLIWMFESPAPFTFPRYRLVNDALTEELPLIRTEAEFHEAFTKKSALWTRFKDQLAASDLGYDSFTFDESMLDRSSAVRLVRRGWVAHSQAYEYGVFEPGRGFSADAADIQVLKRMLIDLNQRTRARGERLIVLLMHTRGHADYLHAALAPTLEQAGIEYLSTHEVFSANDPSNFVPDGHYAERANQEFSKALLRMIRGPQRAPDEPPAAATQPR